MSENPFFQFYPSDWLAGTRGLTAAETGVYITMIAMMYEAEGPIPNDAKRLARLCGTSVAAFKKAVFGLVQTGKLTLDESGFFNSRVQIEIKKRSEKRFSAKKSVSVRWEKTNEKQSLGDTNVSQTLYECDTNQNPETRTHKTVDDDVARDEIDRLRNRLLEAAGDKIKLNSSFVVGPIVELINSGVNLELDILPAIREASGRMTHPAGSWSYFTGWIQKAYARRTSAVDGISVAVEAEKSKATKQGKIQKPTPRGQYVTPATNCQTREEYLAKEIERAERSWRH